jgi:hypothetical protein
MGNVKNEHYRSQHDKEIDGDYDQSTTRRGSVAGGSEESVEPLHKGIMRTTEVQIF